MTNPRIFLIHGWGGSPQSDWFPWAIQEFSKLDYEVITPLMPDTNIPVISSWVDHLSALVGDIRQSDIFIGHSIGCQTTLRYLEKSSGVVAKVILVAPWFTLTNLDSDEKWHIADPWFKTPMDFSKIIPKSNKFITIFSDNDPWVPYLENKAMFEEKLNPEVVVLHNKGHITAEEGSIELPELLDLV
jgi:predicted alpha/beta hydrolase family esterase